MGREAQRRLGDGSSGESGHRGKSSSREQPKTLAEAWRALVQRGESGRHGAGARGRGPGQGKRPRWASQQKGRL